MRGPDCTPSSSPTWLPGEWRSSTLAAACTSSEQRRAVGSFLPRLAGGVRPEGTGPNSSWADDPCELAWPWTTSSQKGVLVMGASVTDIESKNATVEVAVEPTPAGRRAGQTVQDAAAPATRTGPAIYLVATDNGHDPAYAASRAAGLELALATGARVVLYDRSSESYWTHPYDGGGPGGSVHGPGSCWDRPRCSGLATATLLISLSRPEPWGWTPTPRWLGGRVPRRWSGAASRLASLM